MKFEYKGQKVDFMPPIKRYMTRIEWRLRLPFSIKSKVMMDLTTGVCARHEAGESYEDIIADMGTPKQVADSINQEMSDYTWRKSRWRWLFFVLMLCGAFGMLFVSNPLYFMNTTFNASMAVIGGADGPTAIFVTGHPSALAWLLPVLMLIGGLVGFYLLSHIRPKNSDHDKH